MWIFWSHFEVQWTDDFFFFVFCPDFRCYFWNAYQESCIRKVERSLCDEMFLPLRQLVSFQPDWLTHCLNSKLSFALNSVRLKAHFKIVNPARLAIKARLFLKRDTMRWDYCVTDQRMMSPTDIRTNNCHVTMSPPWCRRFSFCHLSFSVSLLLLWE